jgi:lipoate-protein ligase A
MFSLLKVSDEKIKDKLIASAKERVTSVSRQRSVSWQETCDALHSGFTSGKEFHISALSDAEAARAMELAGKRYAAREWNLMR